MFITNEPNIEKYIDKESSKWSRIKDFTDYYDNNHDSWGGKLREKICVLYKVIIKDYTIPAHKVAKRFAFMNLNKRGGDNSIGAYFENYVNEYSSYIIKEINVIDPDIIVWLSKKTFPLCRKYLGAYLGNGKVYMNLNNREVPVLKLPHPSMACCWKVEPIIFQNNRTHGKLASKMMAELERYNLQ